MEDKFLYYNPKDPPIKGVRKRILAYRNLDARHGWCGELMVLLQDKCTKMYATWCPSCCLRTFFTTTEDVAVDALTKNRGRDKTGLVSELLCTIYQKVTKTRFHHQKIKYGRSGYYQAGVYVDIAWL